MIIDNYDFYLANLIDKVNTQRMNKRNYLYEMSVEFSSIDKRNEICLRIKTYFNKFGYGIEIKYCQQCGGRKADIIISIPPIIE